MDTITKAVWIAHTLIALMIIVLVLLQRGKGAEAGAAFGAGASGTVFGSRGSGNFFSRMTAVFATLFFATSLTLAYLSSQASSAPESILGDIPAQAEEVMDDSVPAEDDLPAIEDELPAIDDDELPAIDDAVEPSSNDGETG